ncbi:MAG: AAA family ATPase [Rubrivivax sp.]|nr:AAA family ATPase [Rubrivivax sp.]
MKKGFVITENFRRLADAQAAVEKRGAREAGIVILKGPYGVGKSELVERWAVDNKAIFVRCKETWTKRALLDELADCMGLDKRGRNSEVQARIIGRLAVDMVPLVFDEADFLIRSTAALLEIIRDITDMTGCACFLVGMELFGDTLARYGHIASRVNRVVELQRLTLADVQAACDRLAEVGIETNLVEQILRDSDGRMRLVLNAIANIEQLAAANGWKRVSVEHVKGKPLCVEFKGRALGRGAAQ